MRALNLSLLLKTLPVFMGYIPLGIAFGLLYGQLNAPWYYGVLMSIIVYAGSGQFLLVALLAAHAGYWEILFASFLLNARHIFYGLSIMEDLRSFGWRKHYIIFGLTDETYAMLKSSDFPEEIREESYFWMALLHHFYWCLGGALGILVSELTSFSWQGVEFSLTALFVVLTLSLLLKASSKKPFYLALGVGILALLFLPSEHMLILSILLCVGLLMLLRPYLERP